MRKVLGTISVLALWAVPVLVWAAPPEPRPAARRATPPLIGTHQIDRYDAIDQLQKKLRDNPKSLADWIILGEVAHEVAIDSPQDQAPRYYRMSREAYEKALALSPDNKGLKAAVDFARQQELSVAQFEKQRDQATQLYLDARRRDLAATNYMPAVRVYSPPSIPSSAPNNPAALASPARTAAEASPDATTTTTTTTAPAPAVTPVAPGAGTVPAPGATAPVAGVTTAQPPAVVTNDPIGVRQFYTPFPVYQPYWTGGTAAPYTFQQYSSAYYPPNYYSDPALQPMTIQRWMQQYPATGVRPAGTLPRSLR